MTTLLLFGDTERSPAMRHEVPLAIEDAFMIADVDGRRTAPTTAVSARSVMGSGSQCTSRPGWAPPGTSRFVVGDVVVIEPGLWDLRIGGVRFEDLLLVTDDGCETLSSFSYSLTPSP
jgi:hypothetical protein